MQDIPFFYTLQSSMGVFNVLQLADWKSWKRGQGDNQSWLDKKDLWCLRMGQPMEKKKKKLEWVKGPLHLWKRQFLQPAIGQQAET
jgi:hypothetical protein